MTLPIIHEEFTAPKSFEGPATILITGVMAAGKSTVAQAVAEKLGTSVHLRGDVFRRFIVNGQAEMRYNLSSEAERQLRLRYRLAARAAEGYLEAGFNVVYQDILLGHGFAETIELHRGHPLYVYVLCPSPESVAKRESERVKSGYGNAAEIASFDKILREGTPRLGCWLDNSDLTVEETVETLFAHLGDALIFGRDSD